jgi:hypothetical protein
VTKESTANPLSRKYTSIPLRVRGKYRPTKATLLPLISCETVSVLQPNKIKGPEMVIVFLRENDQMKVHSPCRTTFPGPPRMAIWAAGEI